MTVKSNWVNGQTVNAVDLNNVAIAVNNLEANITAAVNGILDGAPGALDTLNELAAALGDDANFAANITTALAGKQAMDTDLTAIAALTSAANKLLYATGAGTWALTDFTATGRSVVAATDAAAARIALGPQVFDARDYGVIADGAAHNNVANLLDCFTAAYAAGAREVLLPAGVIDTSDAVIGSVTANSGNVYTNNGGIPLPTGDQAVTITGHGKAVTTLKLSAGFTRAFDFWWTASNQSYKGITLRDFTVDRNGLIGTNIAPATAVSSGVTLTPSTWVTLPGISATTFRNAQHVFFPATNAGTANTLVMPSRVSGSTFQVFNTGASVALSTGDLVQGSVQGHVICGTSCGTFRVGVNMYVDRVRVENVDAINVADSSATGIHTAAANRSSGIYISAYFNAGLSPSSTPRVTNFQASNVKIHGGSIGIDVDGSSPGTFVDEVWFEDCFHDTMISPTTTWNSANFMIGGYAWTNRVGMIRCHGRRSGDVAYEIDQPWEGRVEDCLWEEAYTGCYTTTFVPPARTMAGPPTTTLNNGGTLSSSATSVVVTALPASVARSGVAMIETELVWYNANAAGTTLSIIRGFNGSTAASHTNGTTVTFVEYAKCRLWDIRSTIRNKDILTTSSAGRAWNGFENSHLPFVPLKITDPQVELIGGPLMQGRLIYWAGWRPDIEISGMNFSWDSFVHVSGATPCSLISWEWYTADGHIGAGSRVDRPRIYGRNNHLRIHGTVGSGARISAFWTGPGFALIDFDLDYECVTAGTPDVASNTACTLSATAGNFYLAAGSRVGIKLRTPANTDSDLAPTGLNVGVAMFIYAMLDVDIDLNDMTFAGSAGDTNYRPWIIDSSQIGKVRFGKVIHGQGVAVKHASVKPFAVPVSSNYTVKPDDQILLVNTSGGAVTLTLPLTTGGSSSVGEPISRGRELKIIDVGFTAATNNITVAPAATDKIDNGTAGASAVIINTNGGSKKLTASTSMPGWITDGKSDSAAKLATARNIDGQPFDGTADVTVIAPGTHAATSKTTPVDADELSLVDSAASNVLKKLTWANLKAAIKSYYDPVASTLTSKTIALGSNTLSGTTAQFNTALSDNDFATLGGTETLTAKTLTNPAIGLITVGGSSNNLNLFTNADGTVSLSAFGSTNLNLNLKTTGTGIVQANGNPVGNKVSAPATATSTGVPGQWATDSSFVYFCTAANTWLRAAIATW